MGRWLSQAPKMTVVCLVFHLLGVSLAWTEINNEITDIQLTPNNDLAFTISGTGFDPQLMVRPLPQGNYQITIASRSATLNGPEERTLAQQIQTRMPSVESILLSGDETGFQLNLTCGQLLRPQVLSNTPNRIIITLLGKSQTPAQVLTKPTAKAQQKSSLKLTASHPQIALSPQPVAMASSKRNPENSTPQGKALLFTTPADKKAPEKTQQRPVPPKHSHSLPSASQLSSHSGSGERISPTPSPINTPSSVHSAIKATSKVKPALSASRRLASLAPQALEMDWLPTPDQSHPLNHSLADPETLNLLSQADASAASAVTPSPLGNSETQNPSPLRLQRTPAGYQLPADSAEEPSTSNLYSPNPAPSNEYSAFSEPTLQRAADDLRNGRLDNAELSLRGLLAREPNHPQANYLLALIYLSPGAQGSVIGESNSSQKEEARKLLKALILGKPSLAVYQQLIELSLDRDQLDEASTLLEEGLKRFPDNDWLWYQRGRLLEEGKHWDAAQSAYTQALALDAHHPEYHYRLALVHLKQENWPACARELQQALSVAPDDARYLKLMGYLAEKQNTPQAAVHYYKATLQTDAMLYYGRLLQQQKRTTEALTLYQAVESIADNDADLLLSLGTLYSEAQTFQRAKAVLKRLIQLVPDPKDPRHSQAATLLKQLKN